MNITTEFDIWETQSIANITDEQSDDENTDSPKESADKGEKERTENNDMIETINKKTPCRFYMNNRCRFNEKCWNWHPSKEALELNSRGQEEKRNRSKDMPTNSSKKPKYQAQGLPNGNKNMCFMLAPMHMLAKTLPYIETENENEINTLIIDTRKCLQGFKDKEEAENIARRLMQYSKMKWPQYETRAETSCNQEDAAEFLLGLIQEDNKLMQNVETNLAVTTTCSNKICQHTLKHDQIEYIIRTNNLKTNGTIELQDILDEYLCKEDFSECRRCGKMKKGTKEITKAPEKLIIQTERVNLRLIKSNCEINCSTGQVEIHVNGELVKYGIEGVIIHRGAEAKSGHYVYNHYSGRNQQWMEIDDNKITYNNRVKQHNKEGYVFIFKKMESIVIEKTRQIANATNDLQIEEKETNQTGKSMKEPLTHKDRKQSQKFTSNEKENTPHNNDGFTVVSKQKREKIKMKPTTSSTQDVREDSQNNNKYLHNYHYNSLKPKNQERKEPFYNDMNDRYKQLNDNSVPNLRNRRYYVDLDEPTLDKQKVCWWDKQGKCKYGNNCWYSHEEQKQQPFSYGAQ